MQKYRSAYHDFNPRSYKRSDNSKLLLSPGTMISIHAPTRGATLISASRLPYHLNFNPRSYKRSDSLSQSFSATLPISIHAPTRGATISLDVAFSHISISIHAPTRGATNLHINCECRIKFQSTLLQEERRIFSCHLQPVRQISIHAPTRGATKAEQKASIIL